MFRALNENPMDPFSQFRKSSEHYTSTTNGLSLTLTAIDPARFHETSQAVIALANKFGWHVLAMHREGPNVSRLTITPRRYAQT
jgi:hypothetical protein